MHAEHAQTLVSKLQGLPPERIAEVEDFIDFLRQRDTDKSLVQAAQAMSEPVLDKLWDNDTDAEYDRL